MSFASALTDKLYAFLICRSKSNTEFIIETEPRSIGKTSIGRQMVEGQINLAGQVIQQTDEVWNLKTKERDFFDKLHSFDQAYKGGRMVWGSNNIYKFVRTKNDF